MVESQPGLHPNDGTSKDSWMYPDPNVPRHGKSVYKPDIVDICGLKVNRVCSTIWVVNMDWKVTNLLSLWVALPLWYLFWHYSIQHLCLMVKRLEKWAKWNDGEGFGSAICKVIIICEGSCCAPTSKDALRETKLL